VYVDEVVEARVPIEGKGLENMPSLLLWCMSVSNMLEDKMLWLWSECGIHYCLLL
jgi:hypothetical protein